MTVLNDLRNRLSEDPPRLPSWIFVPVTSIPPILDVIHYWIETAKTTKTEVTLRLHKIPDPYAQTSVSMGMPGPMFPHPGNMNAYSQKLFQELAAAALEGMNGQQLVQTGLLPDYLSPTQARQYFESHKSQFVEVMVERMRATIPSADNDTGVKWYMMTKTIPIPRELEARHTALKQLSDAVRQNINIQRGLITKVFPSRKNPVYGDLPSRSLTGTMGGRNDMETQHYTPRACFFHGSSQVLNKILQSEADQNMPKPHKGYPVTSFSLPTAVHNLQQFDPSKCSADGRPSKLTRPDNFQTTYDWISRVLNAAADTLVALKDKVKVEMICAELFSELQSMRNERDYYRPKEFPRSFLRVWMSSIP